MSNGNTDRNSPYYWGTDATYRPNVVPRTPARNTAPQYTIGLDGIPVLVEGSPKPAGTSNRRSQPPASSNTYEVSGVTYDLSSGRAINPRTGKPSPNGYSINPSTGRRTDNPPPLSSPTRDVPKPDGSRGTSTSPGGGSAPIMGMADVDALYQSLGLGSYSDYRPGYSRPKPEQTTRGIGPVIDGGEYAQMVQATNGTRGVGPVANGRAYATNLEAVNRNPGNRNTSTFTSISPTNPQFAEAFGQDLADQRIREANGGITSDRLRNALDDTEGMRGESSMTAGTRGRYAFLDSEDSLVGLRARDRELGVVRAGGRYYGATDNGFKEVSDRAVKDYSANRISGTDFKALFMNEEPVATPADGQSDDSRFPVAATTVANSYAGPLKDPQQYGEFMDATQGLKGMGPVRSGNIYGSFLDNREPMMRYQ